MRPHILIVDDEPAIRYVISWVLTEAGYGVSQAGDGQEALELISKAHTKKQPFDLLVTDIQMPEMSGIELIHELNTQGISPPILVVSGMDDPASISPLLENGCSDFIPKPLDFERLVTRVETVLEKRNADEAKTINKRRFANGGGFQGRTTLNAIRYPYS